jgi:hypothetical protein
MISHTSVAKVLSFVVMLIGLVVAIAWQRHCILLIQISPEFSPMQFNTSLCFFFAGAGLLGSLYQKRLIAILSGLIISLITILTIIQYTFKTDFHLDNFFIDSYIHLNQSPPGRMALITACGLLIASIILLKKSPNKNESTFFYDKLLASFILIIGAIPFFGYISGIDTAYSLWKLTPMAPHTALEFIFLASLSLQASGEKALNKKSTEQYGFQH